MIQCIFFCWKPPRQRAEIHPASKRQQTRIDNAVMPRKNGLSKPFCPTLTTTSTLAMRLVRFGRVARAGIEGVTRHTLRHTFASQLAMNGVNLKTIQVLLGHKTIHDDGTLCSPRGTSFESGGRIDSTLVVG
jgi:integrase